MNTRDQGRAVRNAISSHDPETIYIVRDNIIYLRVPSGIKEEQRALARENKPALLEYLTTPPLDEECPLCQQAIEWFRTEYGNWLCGRCWEELLGGPLKFARANPEKYPTLANYWTK